MRMTVVFEMNLPFAVKRDGRWFVSCCPPLDVCTQGPTAKKAVANLVDALQLFLLSCYERGTLDQVLKKSGFRPRLPRRPGKRKATARAEDTVKVPLPFVIERTREEMWRV